MADSLPVLQGHWRLLEPDEVTEAGDQIWFVDNWIAIDEGGVGWLQKLFDNPIRRRVAPIPKCETCSNSTVNPKMVQQFSCDLAPGKPDERVCLVWEAFVPHDGYCHLHPQAQEVTR